jgi:hypothetical protein
MDQRVRDACTLCDAVADTLTSEVRDNAVPDIEGMSNDAVSKVWWNCKRQLFEWGYMSKNDIRNIARHMPVAYQQIVKLLLSKVTVPYSHKFCE